MDLIIRLATATDTLTLRDLYADMDGHAALTEELWADLWQRIQQIPHYQIFLAFDGEQAIATFSLLYIPTPMHPGFHRYGIIDAVTVKSDRRGQGIGQSMMRWALEKAAADGCYKVMLSSNLQRSRAHEFYRSLGFEQHGWSFYTRLQ